MAHEIGFVHTPIVLRRVGEQHDGHAQVDSSSFGIFRLGIEIRARNRVALVLRQVEKMPFGANDSRIAAALVVRGYIDPRRMFPNQILPVLTGEVQFDDAHALARPRGTRHNAVAGDDRVQGALIQYFLHVKIFGRPHILGTRRTDAEQHQSVKAKDSTNSLHGISSVLIGRKCPHSGIVVGR
ncbi:hypothetical protein D9M69_559500 [compost metagenome]